MSHDERRGQCERSCLGRQEATTRRPLWTLVVIVTFAVLTSIVVPAGSGTAYADGNSSSDRGESTPLELVEFDGTSATIDEAGGRVSATTPTGVHYELVVPPGALDEATEIELVPIASIANLPFDGHPRDHGHGHGHDHDHSTSDDRLLAGVRFAPDGLTFNKFATLQVTLDAPTSSTQAIGFGFAGNGDDFHLYPSDIDGNVITFPVAHFSGLGLAAATPEDVEQIVSQRAPTSSEYRALQSIAAATGTPEQVLLTATAALGRWYRSAVLPVALAAAQSDSNLGFAVDTFVAWFGWVGVSGVTDFDRSITRVEQLLVNGFSAAIDRANATCEADRDLNAAGVVLTWQYYAGTLGLDDGTLDQVRVLDELCVQAAITELTVDPDPLPADTTGVLELTASYSYSDGVPVYDPPMQISFIQNSSGILSPDRGPTDATGLFTADVSLTASRSTVISATACISVLIFVCDDASMSLAGAYQLSAAGYLASETNLDGRSQVNSDGGEDVVLEAVLLQGEEFALPGKTVRFSLDGGGSLDTAEEQTAFEGSASARFTPPAGGIGTSTVTISFETPGGVTLTETVTIDYRFARVSITPAATIVDSGGQTGFSAVVTGVSPDTVSWSTTGGSVDGNGLHTAPSTAGSYTVTATSTADPTLSATATVEVLGSEIEVLGVYTGHVYNVFFEEPPGRTSAGWVQVTASGPDDVAVRACRFFNFAINHNTHYGKWSCHDFEGTATGGQITAAQVGRSNVFDSGQVESLLNSDQGLTFTASIDEAGVMTGAYTNSDRGYSLIGMEHESNFTPAPDLTGGWGGQKTYLPVNPGDIGGTVGFSGSLAGGGLLWSGNDWQTTQSYGGFPGPHPAEVNGRLTGNRLFSGSVRIILPDGQVKTETLVGFVSSDGTSIIDNLSFKVLVSLSGSGP